VPNYRTGFPFKKRLFYFLGFLSRNVCSTFFSYLQVRVCSGGNNCLVILRIPHLENLPSDVFRVSSQQILSRKGNPEEGTGGGRMEGSLEVIKISAFITGDNKFPPLAP
jgi:hypothetical protein